MKTALRAQVLHEWRPLDPGERSLNAKLANPTSQLVPGVMKRLGLEQRLQQSQVFYLWSDIVGNDVARHAQPICLRNGLLIVGVDHPVWLQELSRYHKPLILRKVQERIGKKAVHDIAFRIS